MMKFFESMNFPRAVILVSLVTSGVLGYFVNQRTARLDEIEAELKRVPGIVQDIQRLGIEVDQYMELAAGSGNVDVNDITSFIRITGASDLVGIGELEIIPSDKKVAADIVDNMYKIRPAQKNQRYTRSKIGNFLYKLESDNPRLKVTQLQLDPFKALKPGEIGNDEWKFEAMVTARSQVSK